MALDAMVDNRPVWAAFDAEWYCRTYSSELVDVDPTIDALTTFYHACGTRLRHSPNRFFDERWYLAGNPDVASAVEEGEFASGFEHYGLVGHKDRAPHWLFSEPYYLTRNPDLTASALDAGGYANGYDHYLRTGDREFRSGHPLFDPALHQVADLGNRSPDDGHGEFFKFLSGTRQVASTHRLSWYFDPVWYVLTYPEVAVEIERGLWSCALEHYLCNLRPSEFDPNEHFSEAFYRSIHLDVLPLLTNGRIRNCFDHFLRYGSSERRKPHPDVDLDAYFRAVRVQTEIEQGLFADAFAHFEGNGGAARPDLDAAPVAEDIGKRLYATACNNMLPSLVRHPLNFSYEAPVLSVIMVACNRFAFTLATLASLRSNYPGEIQVILVDSGSCDEVSRIDQYVCGLDVVRLRNNAGFVEGCNAGLQRVRADTTLFINNDVQMNPSAVENAMRRLWADEKTGAVGGKIIRSNGRLQEAGSIVWRDGWVSGYLRDADPNIPEANFVRAVDYCSAAFLLCRTRVLKELDGFDPDYGLGYFEEADLCLRMRRVGLRTIYDPTVTLTHYEHSTTDASVSGRMMARNHPLFRRKNAEVLRRQSFNEPSLLTAARAFAPGQRRILFIEDRLPFKHLGSGFTRSNDIIHAMAALGYHVTLYPIYKATEPISAIHAAFADTIEVIYDRELPDLDAFIVGRSNYYDAVWIARTHNAVRLTPVLSRCAAHLPTKHVVLDTEAVASSRIVERNRTVLGTRLEGRECELDDLVAKELDCAFVSQRIVAVNHLDAAMIRRAGFQDVEILGHMQTALDSPRGWADRRGLLFFAAMPDESSPNLDALGWFCSQVLPVLDERLPADVHLAVAGYVSRRVDLSHLGRHPRVEMLGPITDLQALYGRYRVFVAPTRFAGGIPYKVHEAAAHGLPIVASTLLCRQLGWQSGEELGCASVDDPVQFAETVVAVYNDPERWSAMQSSALCRVRRENNREDYLKKIDAILSRVLEDVA